MILSDLVKTETIDRVLRVELNRPKKKNALNIEMYGKIAEAIAQGEENRTVRVILIHGQKEFFSAGNDISDFQNVGSAEGTNRIRDYYNALAHSKKPLIAAVNGFAIGVAMTSLLHFDLVYAGKSARFRAPFVNLALCPDMGSSYIIPRLVGHRRAAEIFFFCDWLSAEEAKAIGLVYKIFPDEAVVKESLALAKQIAAKPPASIRTTKALLKKYTTEHIDKADIDEFTNMVKRIVSREASEAFKAFLEKRKPDFSKFK